MLNALLARLKQGHQTMAFPKTAPVLPDRFQGRPHIEAARCIEKCTQCIEVCPTDAIVLTQSRKPQLDLGRCLFCGECASVCTPKAIKFTTDHALATHKREHLLIDDKTYEKAIALEAAMLRVLGRSLKLREVSAGGCNACEADTNVLNTLAFDLGRFGIQFVASPRHADGLLITGPVTENMRLALQKTYEAVPEPKIVIAVGACAISGGPYVDHTQTHNGASSVVPVDLFIPGCPPHPITILDGLLRILGKKLPQ